MAALSASHVFSLKLGHHKNKKPPPVTQSRLQYTLYHYLFPLKQTNAILLSCDQYFHVSI